MKQLDNILNELRQLKPVLVEKYNVSSIGLFGSVVRNDFTASSDIDIIVDFNKPIGIEFIDVADLIESKLKTPVDLVSKKGIKQKYYAAIETEVIYV